jgi:hypothetical protein
VYAWGIVLALLAGVASQAGHICQKLVVNEVAGAGGAQPAASGAKPASSSFFSRLLRRPLWVAGLVLEIGVSTVFFLLAQVYLGPALIPGLMATGLIVLAVGSAWLVREPLGFGEGLGIVFLIVSAVLLGGSRLAIDLAAFDILDLGFLRRAVIFSAAVTALFFSFRLLRRRTRHGPLHALGSGLLYVLSNFWVGPFTGAVLRLFRGELGLPVWAMFAFSSAVLVLTNLFGIAELQRAFRVSRAAVAAPLQTLPTQVAPGLMYLLVFRLPAPSRGAVWLFALGVVLIVASSFLVSRDRHPAGRLANRPALQKFSSSTSNTRKQ